MAVGYGVGLECEFSKSAAKQQLALGGKEKVFLHSKQWASECVQ